MKVMDDDISSLLAWAAKQQLKRLGAVLTETISKWCNKNMHWDQLYIMNYEIYLFPFLAEL